MLVLWFKHWKLKTWHRKNLLVLKTSWRRLEDVFSVAILRLPRRLEDALQRRFEDALKTSWRHLGRQKVVTLKTSWRHVLKTWLEDVLKTCLEGVLKTCLEDLLKILWRRTKYLLGISVYLSRDLTNLNVYLTSLYFTNLYLTTLKRIQNALITGDWFGVMKLA